MKNIMKYLIIITTMFLGVLYSNPSPVKAAKWHTGFPKTLKGTWDGNAMKSTGKLPDGTHDRYYSQTRYAFYKSNLAAMTNLRFNLKKQLEMPYAIHSIPFENLRYKRIAKNTYLVKGTKSKGDPYAAMSSQKMILTAKVVNKNKFFQTSINNKAFKQPFYRIK